MLNVANNPPYSDFIINTVSFRRYNANNIVIKHILYNIRQWRQGEREHNGSRHVLFRERKTRATKSNDRTTRQPTQWDWIGDRSAVVEDIRLQADRSASDQSPTRRTQWAQLTTTSRTRKSERVTNEPGFALPTFEAQGRQGGQRSRGLLMFTSRPPHRKQTSFSVFVDVCQAVNTFAQFFFRFYIFGRI